MYTFVPPTPLILSFNMYIVTYQLRNCFILPMHSRLYELSRSSALPVYLSHTLKLRSDVPPIQACWQVHHMLPVLLLHPGRLPGRGTSTLVPYWESPWYSYPMDVQCSGCGTDQVPGTWHLAPYVVCYHTWVSNTNAAVQSSASCGHFA